MNDFRSNDNAITVACQGESAEWVSFSKLDASVIIPTFERSETLKRVLVSLEGQKDIPWTFEIVVVDDGSKDSTPDMLKAFASETDLALKYICLAKNCGPATARNCALNLARGGLVIIIGDDIEPNPEFIAQHMRWHEQNPFESHALLGFVTWPKKMKTNEFMRWLEKGGHAFFFDYINMKDGMEVDPAVYFYTCNVSVKHSMLFKTTLFDETFPYASHEDLELGYRLRESGMKLYFNRSIEAYHWHYLTVRSIAKRVYLMGYSAHIYWGKVLDDSSIGIRCMRKLIANFCKISLAMFVLKSTIQHVNDNYGKHPFLWRMILTLSYWIGMADAMRNWSDNGERSEMLSYLCRVA